MLARKNEGLTLINSIMSLYIFTLLFIALIGFNCSCLKVDKQQEERIEAAYFIEGIRNVILCNYSYDSIKNLCNKNVWYINYELLREDDVFKDDFTEGLEPIVSTYLPYIKISGIEDTQCEVMLIDIKIVYKDSSYTGSFSRGNYEKE